jgi:hypothetical protein
MRGSPTGFRFSDDRTVAESRIVEMLLLAGWAYEQGERREGLIVVTGRVIALAHKLVGVGTDLTT